MLAVGVVGVDRADRRYLSRRVEQRELRAQHRAPAERRLHRHFTLDRGLGCSDLAVRPLAILRAFLRHDVARGLADRGLAAGADPALGGAIDKRVAALE